MRTEWPGGDDNPEVVSFHELARAPPATPEAAAKRFLNLLGMHKEGKVILEQDVPYGDISVHRGPRW